MNHEFRTFGDILSYLDRLGFFHMDLTLDRVGACLVRLGVSRPPYPAVHVVGTNGKGSTATFLASLARAHGLRTGLYTSPHFVDFRERIRIDGAPASKEACLALAREVMAAGGAKLTYFEFLTVLALLAFKTAGVDLAVLEAGLGGAHDATSAISMDMTLFTPIDLDHQAILGDTLEAIATDKAQAMQKGIPAFCAPQQPAALAVLRQIARERACPFVLTGPEQLPAEIPLGLAGAHQKTNASLALAAWRSLAAKLGIPSTPDKERHGLERAFIPGRLQYIPATPEHPALLLDGAHNAHGLTALAHAIRARSPLPAAIIFSCLGDKKMDAVLDMLPGLTSGPIFVPPVERNPRAADPALIAAKLGDRARPMPSLRDALENAMQHVRRIPATKGRNAPAAGPVLICGSLYLLAVFYDLYPTYLNEAYA